MTATLVDNSKIVQVNSRFIQQHSRFLQELEHDGSHTVYALTTHQPLKGSHHETHF